MKVGNYVITNDRLHIGKIYNINEFREPSMMYAIDFPNADDFIFMGENDFKSSPNILNLIQEGDILKVNEIKDVYTIYEVEMFRDPYTNEKYLGIRDDFSKRPKRLYEIPLVNLSILTKEQFSQREYKVDEV